MEMEDQFFNLIKNGNVQEIQEFYNNNPRGGAFEAHLVMCDTYNKDGTPTLPSLQVGGISITGITYDAPTPAPTGSLGADVTGVR